MKEKLKQEKSELGSEGDLQEKEIWNTTGKMKKKELKLHKKKKEIYKDTEDGRKVNRFSREIFGGKEEFKRFEGGKGLKGYKKEKDKGRAKAKGE